MAYKKEALGLSSLTDLSIEDREPSSPHGQLPQFDHTPLASGRGHFRLLKFVESASKTVSFTLTEYPINCVPEYCAVSYTWGPPVRHLDAEAEALYATMVEAQCDGHSFNIGRNIFEALSQFAENYVDTLLWVDAICINQNDLEERNQQVAQMGDIYANATKVIIWLGVESFYPELDDFIWLQRLEFREHLFELEENAKTRQIPGMNPLNDFIDFVRGVNCPDNLNPVSRWQAYEDFLGRCRWWTRAWVLQEVALAQDIEMYCGKVEISWNRLRSLSNLIQRHISIFKPIMSSFTAKVGIELGDHGKAMYALQTLVLRGGPEAIDPKTQTFVFGEHKIRKQECRLFAFIDYALSLVRKLEATMLQDKVYCIFGLIDRFKPPWIEQSIPDYSLSPAEVYYSMASMLAEHSGTLSVLTRVQDPALTEVERLPSWVPDYSISNMYRHIKQPLPDGTDVLHHYHNEVVSKIKDGKQQIGWMRHVRGPVLTVFGTLLDVVVDKVPISTLCGGLATAKYIGGLLRLCRNMKSNYVAGQSRLEVLSRTLTLNSKIIKHRSSGDYMIPLPRFLIYFIALAHVSSERTDGHKGIIEFCDGHVVENPVHKARLEMLVDIEHLAREEPEDWYQTNKMQSELAPALLTMEERKYLWVGSKHEFPPDMVPRAQGGMGDMLRELDRTGAFARTLFLTKRGYLGLGNPSLDVGDGIWAFAGATVPMCVREFENRHGRESRGLIGEVYLHGFMDGWECMKTEGIKDDLVQMELT